MIKDLTINKYKAISKLVLNELEQSNYFVGENGAGKSSLIEAIGMISRVVVSTDQYNGTGIQNVSEVEVSFTLSNGEIHIVKETAVNPENHEHNGPLTGYIFTSYIPNRVNYFATADSTDQFPNLDPEQMEPGLRFPIINKEKSQLDESDKMIIALADKFFENNCVSSRIETLNDNDQVFAIGLGYSHILNIISFLESKIKPQTKDKIEITRDKKGTPISYSRSENKEESFDIATEVILIDEPEYGLNPTLEKLFPSLINYYCSNYNMQFLISTHSPFLIAGVEKSGNGKIYLLKNGKTCDRSQNVGKKRNGYSSKNMRGISSQMLGSSIKDLTIVPHNLSNNKHEVIYLEGENENDNSDANILRKLFIQNPNNGTNLTWLSIGGATNVLLHSHYSTDQCKLVFGDNVIVKHIIDRSCSTGIYTTKGNVQTNGNSVFSIEECLTIEAEYPNSRVLRRREIENYIYSNEIVKCYIEKYPEKINSSKEAIEIYYGSIDISSEPIKDSISKHLKNTTMKEIVKFIVESNCTFNSLEILSEEIFSTSA